MKSIINALTRAISIPIPIIAVVYIIWSNEAHTHQNTNKLYECAKEASEKTCLIESAKGKVLLKVKSKHIQIIDNRNYKIYNEARIPIPGKSLDSNEDIVLQHADIDVHFGHEKTNLKGKVKLKLVHITRHLTLNTINVTELRNRLIASTLIYDNGANIQFPGAHTKPNHYYIYLSTKKTFSNSNSKSQFILLIEPQRSLFYNVLPNTLSNNPPHQCKRLNEGVIESPSKLCSTR